jgi:phage gp37-like protein
LSALVITAAKLGPEQKLFNQLLEKIEDCGRSISELTRLAESHRPERMAKITPLLEKVRQWDTKLVLFLDFRLQQTKGLSKKQQENIAYIAIAIGYGLIRSGEVSEELSAAVDRLSDLYGDDDDDFFDDDGEGNAEADLAGLKSTIEDMMGINLENEEGLDSPEQMMAAAMRKRQESYEAWREAKEARKSKKKKSAKEIAAEQEGMDAESALKQIYRKLASALHPDREPDEVKRIQKTVLMAQVNSANDKKDLLTMLRLQLQIEQIEPAAISSMADEKLRHYNRMLKDQLKTVQMEQVQLTERIRDEFNLYYGVINPKALQKALRADVLELTDQADRRQFEYINVQNDKNLKAWAKHQAEMMSEAF